MQVTVTAIEGPTVNVSGGQEFTIVLAATPAPVVNVAVAGVQGPPGVAGVQGPPGPAGPGGQGVILNQIAPSSFWTFVNPIGRIASVAVFDLAGEEVEADVFCDNTSVTVTFAQPFSGRVVLA